MKFFDDMKKTICEKKEKIQTNIEDELYKDVDSCYNKIADIKIFGTVSNAKTKGSKKADEIKKSFCEKKADLITSTEDKLNKEVENIFNLFDKPKKGHVKKKK